MCKKHGAQMIFEDATECIICERSRFREDYKKAQDYIHELLTSHTRKNEELEQVRKEREDYSFRCIELIAMMQEIRGKLAIERKRSAEAEAKASLNEKALELACVEATYWLQSPDNEIDDAPLPDPRTPDYFRKKAQESQENK
jgi:hypothetical protein